MKAMAVVRALFTIALLFGVYKETGPFTTTLVALTVGGVEILCYVLRKRL